MRVFPPPWPRPIAPRVKKMLAREEAEFSGLFHSLRRALRPLMLEEVHEAHRTAAEALERVRCAVGGGKWCRCLR